MTIDAWTKTEDEFEDHKERSSIFAKLREDGDKVVVAFVGNPHTFFIHRDGGLNGPTTTCAGPSCTECARGKRKTLRFKVNVFVPAIGVMKLLEGGPRMFEAILPAVKKFGADRRLFEITRHGRAGDPKTRYSAMPDDEISAELKARIAKTPLHDLQRAGGDFGSDGVGVSARERPVAEAMGVSDEDLPF